MTFELTDKIYNPNSENSEINIEETSMYSEEYKTITLEKIKIGCQQYISGMMLANMKLDISKCHFEDALIMHLRTFTMKESVKEETFTFTHKKPKNSWHLFKQEWFPKWLLKDFPIEYETIIEKVKFEAYEVYPQLPNVYDVGHHFTEIMVEK